MSDPIKRHGALAVYCLNHACVDCPMDDPQLGVIDDEDECVVALAMDVFRPDLGAKS